MTLISGPGPTLSASVRFLLPLIRFPQTFNLNSMQLNPLRFKLIRHYTSQPLAFCAVCCGYSDDVGWLHTLLGDRLE